jgi:DNA-binding MarR family transcriptional regulator
MPQDRGQNDMTLDEKVMVFTVMASEMFKKNSSAIFRQHGLTFPHYSVLKYLAACDEGKETVGSVSKHMLVTGANVTGLAKRMEKAGLIERKNDAKDERLTMLQITPAGVERLDTIRDIQDQHVGEYLQACAKDEKEQFLSVLKQIVRKAKLLAGFKY